MTKRDAAERAEPMEIDARAKSEAPTLPPPPVAKTVLAREAAPRAEPRRAAKRPKASPPEHVGARSESVVADLRRDPRSEK